MAPVVGACRCRAERVEAIVCQAGQHRELLSPVVEYFGLRPDVVLDLMQPDQSLAGLTARAVEAIDTVLVRVRPDCVVAQGDTTTVMAAALAAFYRRVPLVHVEAGLRTGNLHAPWPEELNRRVADLTATLHCAPTPRAAETLWAEGVPHDAVRVTGNTAVDALLATLVRERAHASAWHEKYPQLADRRVVLVTGHRRESFGEGLENICRAIAELARRHSDCRFVYPVHLNPHVQEPVRRMLSGLASVDLLEPVAYPEFVWLMDRAELILTDSGGVQEEAPSLRKPVLVMRSATDRPEAVEAGAAILVGTSPERIVAAAQRLLLDRDAYAACQVSENPYGDGQAASRIVGWMVERFG